MWKNQVLARLWKILFGSALLALLILAFGSDHFRAQEPMAAVGIPRIDPDYTTDVRDFWANHPLNPRSPKAVKAIRSPEPVVTLQPGDSIDDAIAKLPTSGGTIRLKAGKYEPFSIMGRSHVHILGPEQGEAVITGRSYLAVCSEAMDYSNFDRLVSHFDNVKYRDKRVWDLYRNPPRDFYLKNLIFDGEGKTETSFPGVGIKGPGGALAFKCVRDAVLDHCTFRGYLDATEGLQHCGLAWGHYGLTNIWFRKCRFLGTAKYAVYLDGAHGSGLVDCFIDGQGCKQGGVLFLTNHDFTDDLNENGKIDPFEEKCAKFVVLDGNEFAGDVATPARITGQNCLVTQNIAKGRMLELVGVYPVGEIAHRNWKAGELRMRVTANVVGTCARALLNIFALDTEKVNEIKRSPVENQYTVENNQVEKAPESVRYTPLRPPPKPDAK